MQAYLIIAHKNLEQLKKLLKLLDYRKNDLYIHIDKKAEKEIIEFDFSKCCKYSKVYKFSEYSVNWGSENVINCELFLLKKANENKKYEYYHLISGADLPLKGSKEIYEYFEKSKNKEYINFVIDNKESYKNLENRIKYYRITNFYNILPFKSLKIMRKIDIFQIKLQKILGINRLKKSKIKKFYKGTNWFSITNNLAEDLINDSDNFINIYKNTYCCDEVFLQTYVMNNKYWKEKIKLNEDYHSIMRYIDWNRGGPYVWRERDFDELINSDYLFARKFDEKIDNNIINMIYEKVRKENG